MSPILRVSAVVLGLVGVAALGVFSRHAMEGTGAGSDQTASTDAVQVVDLNGQKFQKWAKPRVLPQLQFVDGEGRARSLADFRGRVILLNLWATWCPPCREEMPALDRLNARLGSNRFQVLTLALDSPAKVQVFLQQIQAATLPPYVDAQGTALSRLGVSSVPTTLLIDAQGREVGRLSGAAAWDEPAAVDLIRSVMKEQL